MKKAKHVSLNLNVRGMGQSATLAIKEKCRALRRQGQNIYDFGLGQSPFPVPGPMVEALRLAAPEKDYLPVMGLPALREAVAEFHRRKNQIDAHPDRILIGPGSKELMFLVQLCYYGEIILPSPCWVSYLPQARVLGRRNSLIHTTVETHWKLTAAQLEDSFAIAGDDLRPRLLVLNYPGNPCGVTYEADELKELAEVARKYHVMVLSDEIYGELRFDGAHVSIAKYYPEGTIVSSGISKWCGAGGWRLGTFTFPADLDWLNDAMAAVASETYTSVSAPIQHAAVKAFRGGSDIERYLAHVRRILSALGMACVEILREGGIRVIDPQGGFYLFLDFTSLTTRLTSRGVTDGAKLCDKLLSEAGVAVLPGGAFGRSRRELSARLSYVDFDGARALAFSERVPLDSPLPPDFLSQCCDRVIDGVRRISDWARREN